MAGSFSPIPSKYDPQHRILIPRLVLAESLNISRSYGWWNQFRPLPELPAQVYMFDPLTGTTRVIADGFDACNGIAFDSAGKIAYVSVVDSFSMLSNGSNIEHRTDTGFNHGVFGNNSTRPATMYVVVHKLLLLYKRETYRYAFDVGKTGTFMNRRVFAYVGKRSGTF